MSHILGTKTRASYFVCGVMGIAVVTALAGACGRATQSDEGVGDAGRLAADAADARDASLASDASPNDLDRRDGAPDVSAAPDGSSATLTVIVNGAGVVSLPNIDCGGTCSVALPLGNVDLEAKASLGAAFAGWSSCPSANGTSCHVDLRTDLTVTADFDTCPAVADEDPHYVDGAKGTDVAGNGGASGACAFRTMTYALAHSKGTLRVAGGTYPTPSEPIPLLLQGTQGVDCPSDGSAVFVNQYNYGPQGLLSLSGTANFIRACTIQGRDSGGFAIGVTSSGATLTPHRIEDCQFIDAFGEAIYVSKNVANLRIDRNSFTRGNTGVLLDSGTSGVSLTANTFSGTSRDLFCYGATVGGGLNTSGGGPIICAMCPFCPN